MTHVYDVKQISGGYEDFDPSLFVGRDNELRLVQDKVKTAQQGSVYRPLIELRGTIGLGKSWFLSRLAHSYTLPGPTGLEKPTISAKVDFRDFPTTGHLLPLLHHITSQIGDQLKDTGQELPIPQSLEEGARSLTSSIVGLLNHYVPVLTLDATEQAEEEVLFWLEKNVVYPILHRNQSIFVYSGRHQERWKIFEVRKRVEPIELLPLELSETAEQLAKLGVRNPEPLAHVLYGHTFGHPLANKAVFKGLSEAPELESVDDDVVGDVILRIIKEQFLSQLKDKGLEPLLEVASILRNFNPVPLRHFASQVIDPRYREKPDDFYLDAIRDMQEGTLVRWSSADGGYILDPVIRRIMSQNLYVRKPDEYRHAHQTAANLYDGWIKQYPRNAISFLIERSYHRACGLRGDTGEKIHDTLASEFDETLNYVRECHDTQWDLPEMALSLYRRLNEDGELGETIPRVTYERLIGSAKQFCSVVDTCL